MYREGRLVFQVPSPVVSPDTGSVQRGQAGVPGQVVPLEAGNRRLHYCNSRGAVEVII